MAYRGKYDVSEFIVPPRMGHGDSSKVQCYVQAGHARALNIVARSGAFPFQERNDVVRWCIKHGLEELDRREVHLINSVMRRTNLLIAMAIDEIERGKFLEAFDALRSAIAAHTGRGEQAMSRDLIARFRDQIERMPEEPERELRWKMKYLDELDQFRHIEKEVAA